MLNKNSFSVISEQIRISPSKQIDNMEVSIVANDAGQTAGEDDSETPTVYFTDVMLQGGTVATSWVGHVSEIKWSFDAT